jgi:hypothetical protein
MGTEADRGQVINPDIFAEPAMVSDRKTPRKLDAKSWLEPAIPADASPKSPQQ